MPALKASRKIAFGIPTGSHTGPTVRQNKPHLFQGSFKSSPRGADSGWDDRCLSISKRPGSIKRWGQKSPQRRGKTPFYVVYCQVKSAASASSDTNLMGPVCRRGKPEGFPALAEAKLSSGIRPGAHFCMRPAISKRQPENRGPRTWSHILPGVFAMANAPVRRNKMPCCLLVADSCSASDGRKQQSLQQFGFFSHPNCAR